MIDNLSIVISSCNKYSDLWEANLLLFKKHWQGDLPHIYLVTDKMTDYKEDGVTVLVYDGDMPIRLKKACKEINSKYIILTLDDYFLIDTVKEKDIDFLVRYVGENSIDYLQLYHRRYEAKKYLTQLGDIKTIDLKTKYAISLYPAIWNVDFFMYCVEEDETPWRFEPELTNKALKYNANCCINNSGVFKILDVVRKGKVLHKANQYLKDSSIYIGDRPLVPRIEELKLKIADYIWWYAPRWFYKMIRKIAEKMGMQFYSEE